MAGDDFLSCVERELAGNGRAWFQLSAATYEGVDEYAQYLDREYGFSIVDLCNLLSGRDDTLLLLDDVPVKVLASGKTGVEEVVSLAQTILDYCPKLKVVVRTTTSVGRCPLVPVVLKSMDEADFNQYILTHPDAYLIAASGMRVEDLFRLSQGEPDSIKRTLSQLRFSRAEDVTFEDSDGAVALAKAISDDSPESLRSIIFDLKASQDRAYSMLECLTVFPNGEDIRNIRNFDPDLPFFPKVAERLMALGLIETVRFSVFQSEHEALPKVLVAKRSVQDHVKGMLAKEELESATHKAISLYFGRDWMLGKFRLNSEFNLDKSNESSFAIQNASVLIRRVVNDALLSQDPRSIQNSLAILNFYTSRLDDNCHYRNICDACHSLMVKLKPFISSPPIQDIIFKYGKSLRMLGEQRHAVSVLNDLLLAEHVEKFFKSRVLIELAFCHEELGEVPEAIAAAKHVLALKDKKSSYYHAKTIIIGLGEEQNRLAKLRALEKRCRNKRYFVAANNIAMQLLSELESVPRRKELYRDIAMRAKGDSDSFNFIKATIRYAALAVQQGESLQGKEVLNLILSYHYVCSQRMKSLFNQAHECLWAEFERLDQSANLVTLFKQSSLLFRLSVDIAREKRYLQRLIDNPRIPLQVVLAVANEVDRIYVVNRMLRLGLASLKGAEGGAYPRLLNA